MTGIKKEDGLVSRQGQGGGSGHRLDASTTEELKEILSREQEFCTLEQITSLLAERFCIQYSPRHLRRIIQEVEMYYYKPQPGDYRRSESAEQRLQKRQHATFDALLLQKIPLEAIAIGIADETGNYLQANTARLWSFHNKAKKKVN